MQLTRNTAGALPSWDDLCAYTLDAGRRDGSFLNDVHALKKRGPTRGYKLARAVVTSLLRQPCYQKMLQYGWGDIIDMMADQVVRNRDIERDDVATASSTPLSSRASERLFRPYNQMPCTRATALKRVMKIQDLVKPDEPVLLLGDDDLVSAELALSGFKDVTALDIDAKVLAEIARIAAEAGVNVKLHRHDLSKPVPPELVRPYKLVSFDPEYSVRAVEMFLNGALALTAFRPGTLIFLNVHMMSLFRTGIPSLYSLFDRADLEVLEFRQGFNAYPAPGRLKGLIRLVNRIVIGSKTLTTEGYAFPYLLSDAILLRKL